MRELTTQDIVRVMTKVFECMLGTMTRGEFNAILGRMAAPHTSNPRVIQAYLEFNGMVVKTKLEGHELSGDIFIYETDDKKGEPNNEG